MRKFTIFTILCLLAAMPALARQHAGHWLSTVAATPAFEQALAQPKAFAPVPKYGDPYWADSIPQPMRQSFIKQASYLADGEWPDLDLGLFAEFRTNGNRTNYEDFIFAKRKRLGSLVMGELMEGKGRFMPAIMAGLQSLCDEQWWGIPAHYPEAAPRRDLQPLALFSAETGNLAAWTYYLLGDYLQKENPALHKRLGDEIQQRVNQQGLSTKEWWRTACMNWNPWICSNWLACVLFVEPDRQKQLQAMREIAESLDIFIDQYPDDGGCDEGAGYWDRAAGSLLDCLVLLNSATGGLIDPAGDDKILAMAEYLGKMNADNANYVNFADASPHVGIRPEWFPGAQLVGSSQLMSLIADAAARDGYYDKPSIKFRADNITHLGRELFALRSVPAMQAMAGKSAMPFDAWLPRIEVLTARSFPNSSKGLFLAAKGGHNNESHNHNDVGSFIVYADGNPVFIDPGRATYTAASFTGDRYKAWNTQSAYHNLPIINGCAQKPGADFKAASVKAKTGKKKAQLSLDIAPAYGTDAKVLKWVRTITLNRGKSIDVTEKYELADTIAPTALVFMTDAKPELADGRVIVRAGGHAYALAYDPKQLSAACEEVPIADDKAMSASWPAVYRVVLTLNSNALKGKIKYSISEI